MASLWAAGEGKQLRGRVYEHDRAEHARQPTQRGIRAELLAGLILTVFR
jgi:hypothetical protein